MSIEQLAETARAMVAPGKGIIAIDESSATCKKRFEGVGIECTEDTRRAATRAADCAGRQPVPVRGDPVWRTIRQSTNMGKNFYETRIDMRVSVG